MDNSQQVEFIKKALDLKKELSKYGCKKVAEIME